MFPRRRRARAEGTSSTVTPWNFATSATRGLKISEITYGNWLTHGSQVENDAATSASAPPSTSGISTFDTADVYANSAAE